MAMSPVRRAFVILLVAAAIVAMLLMLAQDQETLEVRSAIGADDPRHSAYVSALVGAALSRGNRYDVLTNGDQIFPAMLEAIRRAKRRISFETYIYDTGQVANQFTAALEEASRRGVHVNLVVDSVGASGMRADDIKRLEAAGCTIGSAQFSLCRLTVQVTGPNAPCDLPLQSATLSAPRWQTSWSANQRDPSLHDESPSRMRSAGPSKRANARVRQAVRPRRHSSWPLPLASKQ